ncbi:hypothetical protein [Rhizobium leguminosarum]|nr:hypothetical protein [Rhizobium leguminosarum]
MPKMDGVALAIAVRERWPPIEIVVVSDKATTAVAALPGRGVLFYHMMLVRYGHLIRLAA